MNQELGLGFTPKSTLRPAAVRPGRHDSAARSSDQSEGEQLVKFEASTISTTPPHPSLVMLRLKGQQLRVPGCAPPRRPLLDGRTDV